MSIYPEAKQEDTVDRTFDIPAFVAEYLRLEKDGAPEGYYPPKIVDGVEVSRKGEKLSRPHKISQALKKQHKTDAYNEAAKVVAEMKREVKEMSKISPANFSKESDYKAELDKVTKHLDSTAYYEAIKGANGVTSFAELKAACSQSE